MIVIAGVAFLSGIATFIATVSYGVVAALIAAPMIGSLCALLAGIGIAWQGDRRALADRRMNAQIDEAVASLRDVAGRARGEAAPEPGASRHRAA